MKKLSIILILLMAISFGCSKSIHEPITAQTKLTYSERIDWAENNLRESTSYSPNRFKRYLGRYEFIEIMDASVEMKSSPSVAAAYFKEANITIFYYNRKLTWEHGRQTSYHD